MTCTVLCLRPAADFARLDALPPASLDVSYHAPDDPLLARLLATAGALVIPAVGPKLPSSLFDGSALRLVQVTGAGLDRLDQPALVRLGIPVANVPGNAAVAEYAVTSATMLLRRLGWANTEIRNGNYAAFRARMLGDNLAGLDGLLVGIVGLGVIGLSVAEAFDRMGCHICYHDPAPPNPQAVEALGATPLPLLELLGSADIVSLHVPLTAATHALIGDRELAAMKPGVVLIQASRGGIVEEAALAAHLRSGHLGGAAVDVYSTEPPPADHPLLVLEEEPARRLLLTPHIAGVTRQSSAYLFRSAWQNVERVLVRNEPPLHRAY
jgi:phosphoglycerate dehydrogenase-like enzyme